MVHLSWRILLPLFIIQGATSIDVALQSEPPSGAKSVASTLLSFSIEQDRWPDWTGVDSPNNFTLNALRNLAQLTGVPSKIRVGANSEDHTVWSPTVTINSDKFPAPNSITPYPEATSISVGDSYYQLSKFLLPGTHMTWGINLGLNNITNAVNMAKSIAKAFSSDAVKKANVILDLLEIGNEADLYSNNGLRPKGYNVSQYVSDWEAIAGPVSTAAAMSTTGVKFQGAAFAGQGFTPTQIINLGILNSAPGKFISTISQHRYSAAFCNGGDFPLTSFMSKSSVRGNLTLWKPDIALASQHGLRYVLGETNSIACHGAPGVSNTAGAALWVIDYTLQAASLGIQELFFHEGIGFKYNFFQPINLNRSITDGTAIDPPQPPHIMPAYYGGILVNTFIGSSSNAQIIELSISDSNISGYAAYEGGVLKRAIFINLHSWLQSSTGTRPSVTISLNGISASSATAKRLVIQHADDTSGLIFGGQSFETSDASAKGSVVTETIDLQKGFSLNSTAAILISF
ncbi:Beta-glucuronidase C-terminal domain-containing protein [Abortiporus biennis]